MTICKFGDEHGSRYCSPGHGFGGALAVQTLVLFFMMLGIGQIHAQVLYGSIVGNVTDPAGSVVVEADVTACA